MFFFISKNIVRTWVKPWLSLVFSFKSTFKMRNYETANEMQRASDHRQILPLSAEALGLWSNLQVYDNL